MMNTGTKTIRRIVNWFAVVARDSASRGLRRKLIDIYWNLYVEDLKRAKAIGFVAEKVFEFAGQLVLTGLGSRYRETRGRQIDVILVLRLGVFAGCREI